MRWFWCVKAQTGALVGLLQRPDVGSGSPIRQQKVENDVKDIYYYCTVVGNNMQIYNMLTSKTIKNIKSFFLVSMLSKITCRHISSEDALTVRNNKSQFK